MSYEDILKHIGPFGLYQKKLILFLTIAYIPNSIQVLMTVFIFGLPDFRCAIPGLENDTYKIQDEQHAALINRSIPWDNEKNQFSECYVYNVTIKTANETSAVWLDHKTEQSCSSWVYSREIFLSTIVTDLGLVCEWQMMISHAGVMTMVGLLVGSIIGGVLADSLGRKISMFLCLFLQVASSIGIGFVRSVAMLLVLRCVVSAMSVAYFIGLFVLCRFSGAEMTLPKYRNIATTVVDYGWCTGLFALVLAAYLIRDWQTLQLALSCPCLLLVFFWWFIPESPRWLMCKGRIAEARKILEEIAKTNKKELPNEILLSADVLEMDKHQSVDNGGLLRTVLLILKSRTLVIRILILFFSWSVTTMAYYGLTLNVGSIVEGNIYLNFFLLSVMETLAFTVCLLLLDRLGRKKLFVSAILLAGVACLTSIIPFLISMDYQWINTALSNVGKFGVTVAFVVIWLYSAELLPTAVRNTGVGACSVCARVASLVSPYIGNMKYMVGGKAGQVLPMVIFGGAGLLAGILALLLPESLNKALPETVEDAKKMKKSRGAEISICDQTSKC